MYSQRRMRRTVLKAWTLTDDGEIPGKEKMMNETEQKHDYEITKIVITIKKK